MFEVVDASDHDWDNKIERSWNGTLQHQKKFLDYHSDKFKTFYLRYFSDGLEVFVSGVKDTRNFFVSHPGAAFGDFVYNKRPNLDEYKRSINVFKRFLEEKSFKGALLKRVPMVFQQTVWKIPEFIDEELGFTIKNRRLYQYIDLKKVGDMSSGRKGELKKFGDFKIRFMNANKLDMNVIQAFYNDLIISLKRFNTEPKHSLTEIIDLMQRYPKNIELAWVSNELGYKAYSLIFEINRSLHTQYLVRSNITDSTGSMTRLCTELVSLARKRNLDYLSLGVSSDPQFDSGLNEGIYNFKRSLGAQEEIIADYCFAF